MGAKAPNPSPNRMGNERRVQKPPASPSPPKEEQMYRLTAEEAVKISTRNNSDTAIEQILEDIKKAAEREERRIKIYNYGFGDGVMYAARYDKWTKLQQNIYNELVALGYTVDHKADERQFVDLYLEVSW